MKHIYSFFDNEQECLKDILDIHNGGKPIELDPMYNKGMFYKSLVEKPKFRFDINADEKEYDAQMGDATALPLISSSVGCMVLDPLYVWGSRTGRKLCYE